MIKINKPQQFDLNEYVPGNNNPRNLYGLPKKIIFCKECSFSNQKPNSEKEYTHNINSKKPTMDFIDGVCSACRMHKIKQKVDWEKRKQELHILCDKYRKNDGDYDCIVPGSGGKDSFYASYVLKNEFNMNPLTVTWAPHIYTEWGFKNFQSWIHSGFDNYLFTPNGKIHRLLTRLAIDNLFHPFQPFIMGQMYFPPKLALKMNIPLVFYGENPSEYGNKSDDKHKAEKDLSFFSSELENEKMYISGLTVKELIENYNLSKNDLEPYLPPKKNKFSDKTLDVRYLGYYLPWHPQECFYYAVEKGNFRPSPERTTGTYSKYSSIDDKIDDFHYYTTFIKFGIGRATYDSSQEIRNGEITKEEAVLLIKQFDGEYPERFKKEIFEYLSINEKEFPLHYNLFESPSFDEKYFKLLTNKFRSPHIWQNENDKWSLRKTIFGNKL